MIDRQAILARRRKKLNEAGYGALRANELGRVNMVIDAFNRELDAEMVKLRERSLTGIACKKGCAACCTYAVDATTAECMRIAAHIEGMPKARRERVIGRLVAYVREWTEWAESRGIQAAESTAVTDGVHWNLQRKACAFLNTQTHECGIYSVRPLACRAHHACYPPTPEQLAELPHDPAENTSGEIVDPGEGCFQSEADTARGFAPTVWQVDREIMKTAAAVQVGKLLQNNINAQACNLYVGILWLGQQRFGWSHGIGTQEPVPTLAGCFPPSQGDTPG